MTASGCHESTVRPVGITQLLVLLLCLASPARAFERVVSLNLCTDQLLVLLAPEKIAALSFLARDPALSFVAAPAASFPLVRASAEAVLALRPDLVLAARYGAQATLAVLEQDGLHVVRLDLPQSFDAIRMQTRSLAALLGVPARAESLIAAMDATLAAAPHRPHPITALAWEPRGYTAEPGSLMDAVLHHAGLVNAGDGRRMGIEALLRHPPGLLVVPDTPNFPSLATAMLDHPALLGIPHRAVPPALTLCAGPFSARAVELLAR